MSEELRLEDEVTQEVDPEVVGVKSEACKFFMGEVDAEPDVKEKDSEGEAEDDAPEEVIERPYTLRNLKEKDLSPMLSILRKIGIGDFKETLKDIVIDKKSVQEVGIIAVLNVAETFIMNISKAEKEIYELWSDISGIPVDDMMEMEFGTLPLMIMDTFENAKNLSFFKVLSKFFK